MVTFDIDFPNNCSECEVRGYTNWCNIVLDNIKDYINKRHPDCPIIEKVKEKENENY